MKDPQIIDLENCAREPIHIPGAIQPHGVLLVLSDPDLQVVQVSENVDSYLDLTAEQILAGGLPTFLTAEQIERVKTVFSASDPKEHNPVQLQLPSKQRDIQLDGVVHRYDNFCILELEPTEPPSTLYFRDFYKTVSKATTLLQTAPTLTDVLETAAVEFRRITGFDRVMIYRFAPSGDGEVVAEARIDEAEPYLGLWYPASDIPEQARRLYLINPIRSIPEVPYKPQQLMPVINSISGAPTDLSFAGLRSVSPVHCEYLVNMGVTASMSVSIVREGRLWGLVSCHHFTPRFTPFETRNACVFLGQVLSGEITRREAEDEAAFSAKAIGMQAKFLELMVASPQPLLGLVTGTPNLMDLLPAGGAAVITGDKFQSCGIAPAFDEVLSMVRSLKESNVPAVFSTSSLKNHFNVSRSLKETGSGVIALRIAQDPPSYVFFFRPEVAQTVKWGGDPNKPVMLSDDGFRLSPRKSFKVWQERVEGAAIPWTAQELRVADELRKLVLAVTARAL